MAKQRTYRGEIIDFGALRAANAHAVALGNANMNARGDILGKGGKIVKTREEQAQEYYAQYSATQVKMDEPVAFNKVTKPQIDDVDLNETIADVVDSPEEKTTKSKRQPRK